MKLYLIKNTYYEPLLFNRKLEVGDVIDVESNEIPRDKIFEVREKIEKWAQKGYAEDVTNVDVFTKSHISNGSADPDFPQYNGTNPEYIEHCRLKINADKNSKPISKDRLNEVLVDAADVSSFDKKLEDKVAKDLAHIKGENTKLKKANAELQGRLDAFSKDLAELKNRK